MCALLAYGKRGYLLFYFFPPPPLGGKKNKGKVKGERDS